MGPPLTRVPKLMPSFVSKNVNLRLTNLNSPHCFLICTNTFCPLGLKFHEEGQKGWGYETKVWHFSNVIAGGACFKMSQIRQINFCYFYPFCSSITKQKLTMLTGHNSQTFLIFASLLSVKYLSVKFWAFYVKIICLHCYFKSSKMPWSSHTNSLNEIPVFTIISFKN